MAFDEFRGVHAGEDRRLTGAALRQPRDAERCIHRNKLRPVIGNAFVCRAEKFLAEERLQYRKLSLKKRIASWVGFAYSDAVEKEKYDLQGVVGLWLFLLSRSIVTGPLFTSSTSIIARNTPVATRCSPNTVRKYAVNSSYKRSASCGGAASM